MGHILLVIVTSVSTKYLHALSDLHVKFEPSVQAPPSRKIKRIKCEKK